MFLIMAEKVTGQAVVSGAGVHWAHLYVHSNMQTAGSSPVTPKEPLPQLSSYCSPPIHSLESLFSRDLVSAREDKAGSAARGMPEKQPPLS